MGGSEPSMALSTNNGACFSFSTRLLGSAAFAGAGGVITGGWRFSRSLMCLVSASSRSIRRSLTLACSRRSGTSGAATVFTRSSTSRNWATSCLRLLRALHQRFMPLWISSSKSRVILPVMSITRNQDRSANTVRPKRNSARNSSVLPCTFSAATASWPRLSPSAPPADAGMLLVEWKWIYASAAPERIRNTRPIRRQENSQPFHCQGWWRLRNTCQVFTANNKGNR